MIHIFKTSVETVEEIKILEPIINELFSSTKWNFDLEDCNNIFKVKIPENNITHLKSIFKTHNFECKETF